VIEPLGDHFEANLPIVQRVKQLVGSQGRSEPKNLRYKDIELDVNEFRLQRAGQDVGESLTKKETMILRLLLDRVGSCVGRKDIKNSVWRDLVVTERTVDSHVSRLRKRLEGTTVTIESVYGGGYTLL
jgi:DNA-binding response OmpR family regulator